MAGGGASRRRVKRDPEPALTRDDVIDAAVRFIDERGLEALTMRALGNELGVYPTTLYWHTGNKAQLIAAASARIFDEIVLPDERSTEWGEWLAMVARRCREAMHRHPNLAPIAGSQLVVSTSAMPFVERVIGVLEQAGFSGQGLVDAYNSVIGLVLGWVTTELSAEPRDVDPTWKDDFAGELRSLNPNSFPALNRNLALFENNAFMTRWDSGRIRPMERSFEAALDLLLRGLRSTLR